MKGKKIGEGWDYTVYKVSASKVRKIRKTYGQLLWLLIRTINIVPAIKLFINGELENAVESSTAFVKKLIEEKPEIKWFFGNPEFEENDGYTQDKVYAIRECFTTSFERRKKLIDGYVTAIHFMWQHGFSDTSFKFSKNYGILDRDRIILIDFSNLTTDKQVIEKMLLNNFLLKVWVYRKMTDWRLKKYYKEVVQKELTVEKLHELWK